MNRLTVFFFLLLSSLFWAQNKNESVENKTIKHTVSANETVLNISKLYGVDPSLIYRNNRFALDKIEEGMILTFPAPKTTTSSTEKVVVLSEPTMAEPPKTEVSTKVIKETSINESKVSEVSAGVKTHKVQSGETLYGLSKKYGVSIEALKESNPRLAKVGLQIGQLLKIPTFGTTIEIPALKSTSVGNYQSGTTIKHVVQPKETLYGLSKKYGVSIESIQNQNQKVLVNGLQTNQTLLITIN